MVTTIAKLVPMFVFVLIAIFAFNYDKFTFNFWGAGNAGGTAGLGSILRPGEEHHAGHPVGVHRHRGQPAVYSAHAARRSDVGRATVIGFRRPGIYVLVSTCFRRAS